MRATCLLPLALVIGSDVGAADPPAPGAASADRSALLRLADDVAWRSSAAGTTIAQALDTAELIEQILAANRPTFIELEATGILGGGATNDAAAGELSAMASLKVRGERCDLADVGLAMRGDGSGLWGAGANSLEARGWAAACLANGIAMQIPMDEASNASGASPAGMQIAVMPIRARADVALNATPAVTAARAYRRDLYSELSYELSVEGLRLALNRADRGMTFLFATLGEHRQWDGVPNHDRALYEVTADFGFFRLFRARPRAALADRAIDILAFHLRGTRGAGDAALAEVAPLRMAGVALGDQRLLLDATLGIAFSGGTITVTSGSADEIPDEVIASELPDVTTWSGRGGLTYGDQARALGVAFVRSMDANTDLQLVVENRATLWAQRVQGRLSARAEVFAGQARRHVKREAGDETSHERFGGGYLTVDYNAHGALWAGLRAEILGVIADTPTSASAADAPARFDGASFRVMATLSMSHTLWGRPLR